MFAKWLRIILQIWCWSSRTRREKFLSIKKTKPNFLLETADLRQAVCTWFRTSCVLHLYCGLTAFKSSVPRTEKLLFPKFQLPLRMTTEEAWSRCMNDMAVKYCWRLRRTTLWSRRVYTRWGWWWRTWWRSRSWSLCCCTSLGLSS